MVTVLWLAVSLLPYARLAAQEGPQPTKKVIHLWVDPRYGNDALAASMNPRLAYPDDAMMTHANHVHRPNEHLDTNGNPLLHAPWPFKTIGAAVAYIPALPYSPRVGDVIPPQTSQASTFVWEYAIVHLLAGRYAEGAGVPSAGTEPDPWNGLIANGETGFAGRVGATATTAFRGIQLPNRVSIQGTSALNTVIDFQTYWGPIFSFGNGGTNQGIGSSIDSVTFLGVTPSDDNANGLREQNFAAVYLGRGAPSQVTISNCFFLGNWIGVMVDAPLGNPNGYHTPTIVNCTFAWNFIALWNGETQANLQTGGTGVSRLLLINNIFDASPILPQHQELPVNFPTRGMSCFDGVDLSDLRVQVGSNPNTYQDFNAYESSGPSRTRSDSGWGWTNPPPLGNGAQIAPTQARVSPPAVPGIDLTPWNGGGNPTRRRGTVFVRDLLLNGPPFNDGLPARPVRSLMVPQNKNWDRSPHDFRLAPAVAPHTAATPGTTVAPTQLHIAVDAGWNGPLPGTMENGRTLLNPPGWLDLGASQASWPHHSWQHDCEGYANPRIHDHPLYGSSDPNRIIDVGADELGEFLIPGYRIWTTTFLSSDTIMSSLGAIAMRNRYAFYLGPPTGLANAPAPSYTTRAYYTRQWVDATWVLNPAATPGLYAPKSVDVTPHLLPDLHPWWLGVLPPFPTNPLWEAWLFAAPTLNSNLYVDPTSGIINPSGTVPTAALPQFTWLDQLGTPPPTPVLWPALGGPTQWYCYGPWCDARSSTPVFENPYDAFTVGTPASTSQFSLEHKDRQPFTNSKVGANIQSFAVHVTADTNK